MLRHETKPLLSTTQPKRVSFFSLYASFKCYDYFILSIGSFLSVLYGLLPAILSSKIGEIFQQLSDHSKSELYSEIQDVSLIMVILGTAGFLIGTCSVVTFSYIGSRNTLLYRTRLFKKLINKPIWWYDTHRAENLSVNLHSDLELIEKATGEKVMVIIYSSAMFASGWISAFVICTPLALIAVGQVPIFILARYIIDNPSKEPISTQSYIEAKEICNESLQGIKTVSALCVGDELAEKYKEKESRGMQEEFKHGLGTGVGWAVYYVSLFMFQGFILYFGARLIRKDQDNWITGTEITPEAVIIIFFAGIIGSVAIFNIPPALHIITSARIVLHRLNLILKENFDEGGPLDTQTIQGDIHFKNLSFAYPLSPGRLVLQNFSLAIPAKQTVAIIGEKGSGKTTLFNLLLRFYLPIAGNILLDNIDLSEFNIYALRKIIGVLNRDPIVFRGSILENIQIASYNTNYEDIVKAAKMSGAHEFITDMKAGYETKVENGKVELSREQKLKISIARIFLKRPKILLVDDTPADLEPRIQEEIDSIIDFLRQDKTTLIITNRIFQAKLADNIIVLSNNTISESGTHEELLSNQGYYYNLFTSQNELSPPSSPSISPRTSESNTSSRISNKEIFKRSMLDTMRYCKWVALVSIGGMICGGIFPVYGYILSSNMYDITQNQNLDGIKTNLIWLLLESLILLLAIMILIGSIAQISSQVTSNIRRIVFSSVLYYDMKFWENNHHKQVSESIDKDSASMSNIASSMIAIAILIISSLSISFLIGSLNSIPLASFTVFFLSLLLFIFYKVHRASNYKFTKSSKKKGDEIIQDAIIKIKTMQAMNGQARISHKYSEYCEYIFDTTRIRSFKTGFWFGAFILVLYLSFGASAWLGAYLIEEDEISYEEFVISIMCVLFGSWCGMVIVSIAPNYSASFKSAKRIYSILDYPSAIKSPPHTRLETSSEGNIEFLSVKLAYKDTFVLSGVSLNIQHGDSVGILGKQGTGKTSLCNLLMRFYECSEGSIRLNDVDIRDYDIYTLRSYIAVCFKEPFFFYGTLKDNMKLANKDVTDSQITEVLKIVRLEGYQKDRDILNRTLEKSPLYSSAEELQRLAIARALLRSCHTLLLDEATSALPSSSAVRMLQDLKSSGKTLIFLSTKLSHLKTMNSLYQLKGGQLSKL
jgi:ATP-binding cassette subfamily B (MDR/TAP) protein 1